MSFRGTTVVSSRFVLWNCEGSFPSTRDRTSSVLNSASKLKTEAAKAAVAKEKRE